VTLVPPELMLSASDRQRGDQPVPAVEASSEDRLNPAAGAPPQIPGSTRPEPAASGNSAGALTATPLSPASDSPTGALAQTPEPPLRPAPPSPAQPEAAHAYGVVDGTARIVIRATADSWIRILSTERTPLFERTLKPGETYLVPDQPGVSMRTGNAGGLEITVDGKPMASIGPAGTVRTLPLEPQALISRTAAGG